MKKLLVLFAVLTIGTVSFAQDSSIIKKHNHSMMKHNMSDCVMMKDGKMMMMKNGKMMAMDKDMTMSDGSVCMMDGTCKMKNGKTMMMKNGDTCYMSGKMRKMKMDKMAK
jgi:Domain of unknown function (DUF6799)